MKRILTNKLNYKLRYVILSGLLLSILTVANAQRDVRNGYSLTEVANGLNNTINSASGALAAYGEGIRYHFINGIEYSADDERYIQQEIRTSTGQNIDPTRLRRITSNLIRDGVRAVFGWASESQTRHHRRRGYHMSENRSESYRNAFWNIYGETNLRSDFHTAGMRVSETIIDLVGAIANAKRNSARRQDGDGGRLSASYHFASISETLYFDMLGKRVTKPQGAENQSIHPNGVYIAVTKIDDGSIKVQKFIR